MNVLYPKLNNKNKHMKNLLITLLIITSSIFAQSQDEFEGIALDENFVNFDGNTVSFGEILKMYKGKTIFIDIWASWCHDCVGSIPKLQDLQKNNKELVYLMLSLDKDVKSWKTGIEKHNLKGKHYLFTKKWKKSSFCKSIALDWIPRYMIVGKDGAIKMFRAIEFSNKDMQEVITEETKSVKK